MTTIKLTLPYPVSANRYWRTYMPKGFSAPVTTLSAEAKDYKAAVRHLAKQAGVREPIACRVQIDYTLYPKRPQDWERRAAKNPLHWDDTVQCIDLDNAQKVLLDALKGVVIQDDGWQVRRIHAERGVPDGEARIVVVVTTLNEASPQAALFSAVA